MIYNDREGCEVPPSSWPEGGRMCDGGRSSKVRANYYVLHYKVQRDLISILRALPPEKLGVERARSYSLRPLATKHLHV